jgi:acylphosphatase
VHVVVDGRVQGVGFRYAAYRRAQEFGLGGWVRNLDDGRVEAEFEGPREALEQMLEWCRRGPSFAWVKDVDETWLPATQPPTTSFRIEG